MESENIYTVIYYFIKDNIVNYIEDNDNNNSLKTMNPKELNKPENAFHYFRPFEPFRNTYEDLIKFKSIFQYGVMKLNQLTYQHNIENINQLIINLTIHTMTQYYLH